MNTLPPASVPSASASAQALSNSNAASSSSGPDNGAANASNADTSTSGNFHQVLNQQIAQNNGSAGDAKAPAAQAAAAGAASKTTTSSTTGPASGANGASSKSTKSTHSAQSTSSASGSDTSNTLTAQQAAALAAAAQSAQAADPAPVSDVATASAAIGSSGALSSQLAISQTSSSPQNASDAEAQAFAGDNQQASVGADNSAVPGSVWGAMDGSHQHMLMTLGGKSDSDDASLSGGFSGQANGAWSAAEDSTSAATASAFQLAARSAMNSEQSLFSDAGDKLHGSSDVPTTSSVTGSSDATLAAAQASTTQVGTTAPAASAGTVASASVPYQMGSDAWRADVSSHVLYFSQQDISSAQLHLNPAHLSPLNISISVDNNQTSIAFNAAHEATRQAMQDSLPQLREMFNAHGIALGQTTVGDSSAGSAQQQNQHSSPSGAGIASPASKALESSSTALGGSTAVRIRSLQIVDTFA